MLSDSYCKETVVAPVANLTAVRCFDLAAQYNLRRLFTYQQHEVHGDRIRIRSIGSATVLRFDDVGYFNSVYAPDESIVNQLTEVEEFFSGCPFGCTLVAPPVEASGRVGEACRRRNWRPGPKIVWMHASTRELRVPPTSREFTIRPPLQDEREIFLHCYLESFEADPGRFGAAVRNMRHLFKWPDLHFLLAVRSGQPVGVAMLLKAGEAALFCAGAALPNERNQGCHSALLGARVRLARELQCREIFSWAHAGSQSEVNMARAGLEAAGITEPWTFHCNR
jgi:hypothetical protein